MAASSPEYKKLDLHASVTTKRLLGLWRLSKHYRLTYLGAIIGLGLAALVKTNTYLLIRYYIDEVLGQQIFDNTLILIGLAFVGMALFEGSFSFIGGALAARTSEGITRRLRDYVFDHIQRLTYAYHAETPTGDLIQRSTSDVDALRRFFSDQAVNAGRILLMFTINLVAMISLNLNLALISLIVIPFIVIMSGFFFKRVSKAYEKYQEQEASLSTTLQENLSGVRVVKAFARQTYEKEKFEKDNIEKYKRGVRLLTMHSLFWPVSDTLIGLQMVGGYIAGALMAINGDITVGTYMAYTGLIVWLIFPMRNLGRLIVQMSTGLVSYHRVTEILKQEKEPLDEGDCVPEAGIRGDVAFENVSFEYKKDSPILRDVSFSCKHGHVIALLGSTGSGKTSLVNLLPRFYDPTAGRIVLDGEDLKRYPRRLLRDQIGIVEQEPFLFSRSIRENITYGVNRVVTDDEVVQAAQMAAIHDSIITFPEGYKTLVGEKGVTLSGGQKQRVAIARALLKNPRILIMDDSTSSVDTETEGLIRQALEHLMRNRTTFIIAHRIQSIMTADLILVFDKGCIVQAGTHPELVAVDGMYRQIYDIQTRIDAEVEKEVTSVSV